MLSGKHARSDFIPLCLRRKISESVSWTQIVKNQWERSTSDATDRKGHRCLLNPAITVDVGDATTSPMQDRSILGPFHGEGFPAQGAEG